MTNTAGWGSIVDEDNAAAGFLFGRFLGDVYMNRRDMGEFGEQKAAEMLLRSGYRIIERNYSCRSGEIDIIAMTGMTLVFVEVKSRSGDLYGSPGQSVTKKKQDKIRRTAMYYIKTHDVRFTDIRFDVVEVMFDHICDAF